MKNPFKPLIIKATEIILNYYGKSMLDNYKLEVLLKNEANANDLEFLKCLPKRYAPNILEYLGDSCSQYRQDLFALAVSEFKRGGFFIEFGATDGIRFSNTYLLEKKFGWSGILAEPALSWHKDLDRNRTCLIEKSCVWHASSEVLDFREVSLSSELSGIVSTMPKDGWNKTREEGKNYKVSTISLLDMLKKHNAPYDIDYLSIDTEGSELAILKAFDFTLYNIKAISCEHNFTADRELIYNLLLSNGYKRMYQSVSHCDDWYVKI